MEQDIKRLPKGISDYKDLRTRNFYYVDKTMYLPKLEDAGQFLFFVRPRRFGKSLFLNMLSCYYDVAEKDNFDRLFGDTWIAKHPTREKNSYLMLRFDFSRVKGKSGDVEAAFEVHGDTVMNGFIRKYGDLFEPGFKERTLSMKGFDEKFEETVYTAQRNDLPIYLIVDEYDNFTNDVLNSEGNERYRALTHGEGFYRKLFSRQLHKVIVQVRGLKATRMEEVE